jgi:glycosyltransferase involved in cell wall biosynthesis
MDVLLACGTGEGFCVPLIEAQSCGTSVVCGDWTSMSELVFAGWVAPRATATVYGKTITDDDLWGQLEGCKVYPRVSAIVAGLEAAYRARGEMSLREQARAGGCVFDARHVMETRWQPLIAGWE